jgi:hypothetical protein
MGDTILGHPIPFPLSDLYIAIATVALFLPTVVLVHRTIGFLYRRISGLVKPKAQ